MPELCLPQVRLLPIQQLRYTVPIGTVWPWEAAQHANQAELAVPSFDCMQIRVADSQSRTPGWVSVNAFAHLQLREGACARAPVVFPLVSTLETAREQ